MSTSALADVLNRSLTPPGSRGPSTVSSDRSRSVVHCRARDRAWCAPRVGLPLFGAPRGASRALVGPSGRTRSSPEGGRKGEEAPGTLFPFWLRIAKNRWRRSNGMSAFCSPCMRCRNTAYCWRFSSVVDTQAASSAARTTAQNSSLGVSDRHSGPRRRLRLRHRKWTKGGTGPQGSLVP